MDSPPSGNERSSLPLKYRTKTPPWLPISLLIVTTAALTAPIFLLRRQRSRVLSVSLPPRRPGNPSILVSRFTPISKSAPSSRWPPIRRRINNVSSVDSTFPPRTKPTLGSPSAPLLVEKGRNETGVVDDGFNDSFNAAKAFGIATLIVTACASTAVWVVKAGMGVKDAQEFADQIRHVITTKLSFITYRIYRQPPELSSESGSLSVGDINWKWSEAEERLNTALEKGGAYAWAEAVMKEMEHEASKERIMKGIDLEDNADV